MTGLLTKISAVGTTTGVNQFTVKDVRSLTNSERRALGIGPTIELYLGPKHAFTKMPKRVLMAFSEILQQILQPRPDATGLQFHPGQVSQVAFKKITAFMHGHINSTKPFNIKPGANLIEDIEIYRFGRLLGFCKDNYLYGLFRGIRAQILDNSKIIEYEELDEILTLEVDDPVYRVAVAVFDDMRHKKQIEDTLFFENWVNERPKFAHAMDEHKKMMQEKSEERRAAREAKAPKKEEWEEWYDWRAEAQARHGLLRRAI